MFLFFFSLTFSTHSVARLLITIQNHVQIVPVRIVLIVLINVTPLVGKNQWTIMNDNVVKPTQKPE